MQFNRTANGDRTHSSFIPFYHSTLSSIFSLFIMQLLTLMRSGERLFISASPNANTTFYSFLTSTIILCDTNANVSSSSSPCLVSSLLDTILSACVVFIFKRAFEYSFQCVIMHNAVSLSMHSRSSGSSSAMLSVTHSYIAVREVRC